MVPRNTMPEYGNPEHRFFAHMLRQSRPVADKCQVQRNLAICTFVRRASRTVQGRAALVLARASRQAARLE